MMITKIPELTKTIDAISSQPNEKTGYEDNLLLSIKWQHPTGQTPKKVSLVCLGHSRNSYVGATLESNINEDIYYADEVWTLNRGVTAFKHDLLFVMDHIQGEADKHPRYGSLLWKHDKPIITSDNAEGWPSHIYPFPFREIWNWLATSIQPIHGDWYHNSLAYILVYAAFIGVKELQIFGADYHHHSSGVVEDGHPNVAYWVGKLEAIGLIVKTPTDSGFLNANQRHWIYGYRDDPRIIRIHRAQFRALTHQYQSTEIDSGERQVFSQTDLIQYDHVARYQFAIETFIAPDDESVFYDIGCGIGYGAKLIADVFTKHHVVGCDKSHSTLLYQRQYYQANNLVCLPRDMDNSFDLDLLTSGYAATAFEVIEHLSYPEQFLKKLPVKYLLASVPNQDVVPFSAEHAPFHHRHYTKTQFEDLLNKSGWSVISWHGQTSQVSNVIPYQPDCRTLIVYARRQ